MKTNEEYTLFNIIKLIRRKWMIFCISFFLLVSISVSSILVFVDDKYTARASIMVEVQNASNEYDSLMTGKELVSTYKQLALTEHVFNEVRDQMNIYLTNEELSRMISADSKSGSIIIDFYVESNDALLSRDIAENLIIALKDFSIVYLGMDHIQILDYPSIPVEPSGSNHIFFIILAFFGGVLLSSLISFFSNIIDNKVYSKDDLELVTRIPVIGKLLNYKYTRNNQLINGTHQVITNVLPYSPISEEYNRIKTNIDFATMDRNIKIINITSSMPKEGKTLISLNLAFLYSRAKTKTLLIDLNMYNKHINSALCIENIEGLADALVDKEEIDRFIQQDNEYLDVLPFGTPTDITSDIYLSNKFKELLLYLNTKYDKIIIDTPAISHNQDGVLISMVSDATVLAVRAEVTEFEVLQEAIDSLKKVEANLIGIVLSNIKRRETYSGAYTSYGFEE